MTVGASPLKCAFFCAAAAAALYGASEVALFDATPLLAAGEAATMGAMTGLVAYIGRKFSPS